MIIAVDFDGTIVKHEFPDIGPPVPGAIKALLALQEEGHKLILWTVRIGVALQAAKKYCEGQGIKFWGVNENPGQKYWNGSPKAYAEVYIDDSALGCPVVEGQHERGFVDWPAVMAQLGVSK